MFRNLREWRREKGKGEKLKKEKERRREGIKLLGFRRVVRD